MLIDLVCHYWRIDPPLPFRVKLHEFPLHHLIADAQEAHRVYELMSIRRPGDVWKYIWVELLDVPPSVHSSRKWRKDEAKDSRKWPDNWLPLTEFDRCFYWAWDDTKPESQCWLPEREGPAFKKWAEELFAGVKTAQLAVQQAQDILIQIELAQMAATCHYRDYEAATPFEITPPDYESPVKPRFSQAFYDKLSELIRRPEVNCFSFIGEEYQVLRLAFTEQRLRFKSDDPLLPANSWPISILADFVHGLRDWNAQAQVYSEGIGYGYLMVCPGEGSRRPLMGRMRWLLCETGENEVPGFHRSSGDGWCLYQDLSSDEEFAQKSSSWRWMLNHYWKVEV